MVISVHRGSQSIGVVSLFWLSVYGGCHSVVVSVHRGTGLFVASDYRL